MTTKPTPHPLDKLRAPFPPNQVSKLPKPTKAQTDAVAQDFRKGIRCTLCGAWHHPDVVHLDYVGHAALTDRLLDTDPAWKWEPQAYTPQGLPAFDESGGLWIVLTVCGVSRLGYGHAKGKPNADPGAREKEVIGDALRNAAMRFGAALDLWHKGDLHAHEVDDEAPADPEPKPKPERRPRQAAAVDEARQAYREAAAQAEKPTAAAKANTPAASGSLQNRALIVEGHIKACETIATLDAVLAKASQLFAQLDTADPERLKELDLMAEFQRDLIEERLRAATPKPTSGATKRADFGDDVPAFQQ